jgi:hypothetical protein
MAAAATGRNGARERAGDRALHARDRDRSVGSCGRLRVILFEVANLARHPLGEITPREAREPSARLPFARRDTEPLTERFDANVRFCAAAPHCCHWDAILPQGGRAEVASRPMTRL